MAALALEQHVSGGGGGGGGGGVGGGGRRRVGSGRVVAGVGVACGDIDANTGRVTPATNTTAPTNGTRLRLPSHSACNTRRTRTNTDLKGLKWIS